MKRIDIKIDVQGKEDVEKVEKDVKNLDDTSKKTADGGLKDLVEESGVLGKELGILNRIQGIYNTGLKAMGVSASTTAGATSTLTKGLRLLKIALISTGIGAIAVVVGTLASAFFSTQAGVDALNRVLVPLKEGFNGVWGLIQDIALNWRGVIDGLVQGFQRVANIALQVAQGNFRQAFQLSKDLISDASSATVQFGRDVVTAFEEGAEAGARIVELEEQLEQRRVDNLVRLEELNKTYEEMDTLSDNINLTEEERIDAINRGLEALEERNTELRGQLDQEIEILRLKQQQNDTTREEQLELQRLIAERERFESETIARARTLTNRRNQLQEQIRTNAEEERQLEIEQQELEAQGEEKNLQREREIQQRLKELRAETFEEEMEARVSRAELERDQRMLEIEAEVEDETLRQAELQLVQAEFQDEITKIEKEQSDARIKIAEEEKQARTNIATELGTALSTLTRLLGEQTALGKALGVVSATIDTYVGANKALAQGGIFGAVAAAGIIATGLGNVRQILSTKVPSIQGQPLGTPASSPLGMSQIQAPNIQAPEVGTEQIQTVQTVFPREQLQVVVLESDITQAQQTVTRVDERSTI